MASPLFKDQVVLITGASAGFGASIAEAFAKEGARLIILARRRERLFVLAQKLKDQYETDVLALAVDISDEESVKNHLSQLPSPFSGPDILINNAGLAYGRDNIWSISSDDMNATFDTNVKGLIYISQQIIPKMIERKKGLIINIGSVAGHESYPGGGVYCASKFAVRALTDTLRKELVDTPLRVSMISPGMAKTEFSLVRYKGDKEKAEGIYKGIEPLLPDDITQAVIFIASRPPHVNIADMIIYPTHQASVSLMHRTQ